MKVLEMFPPESAPRRSPRRDVAAYRVGGLRVPSVTEVLDISGVSDIERLIEKAGFETVEAAAHRGQQVHGFCELADLDDQFDRLSVPEHYRGYVDAYLAFRVVWGFEPAYIEHPVVSPTYGFAGTVDRIGFLRTGQVAVLELKTPAAPMATWPIQTAGYALAVEDSGVTKHAFRGAVRLRPDGTFRFDRHCERRDTDQFLACLSVTNFKLAHGLAHLES